MADRHPNKHIQAAIEYAVQLGWEFRKSRPRAHAYGVRYCPAHERAGCHHSVYSTPRHPEGHAKRIRRFVDRCPHS